MKRFIIAAALAATTIMTVSAPEAEARGGRGFGGGGGFRGGVHHGGGFRHHGFRHRSFAVYPVYSDYCRWVRTPYGVVKRCY